MTGFLPLHNGSTCVDSFDEEGKALDRVFTEKRKRLLTIESQYLRKYHDDAFMAVRGALERLQELTGVFQSDREYLRQNVNYSEELIDCFYAEYCDLPMVVGRLLRRAQMRAENRYVAPAHHHERDCDDDGRAIHVASAREQLEMRARAAQHVR